MKNDFQITMSVVSHGDSGKIKRLLASVQKNEPNLSRFQLILTDNLWNELPDFKSACWGSVNVLRNRRPLGFAENHNSAFKIAGGEYFAIINPDLIFECPIFVDLIKSLHTNNADLIAPVIVDENGKLQDSFRKLPTPFELIRRRLPSYAFMPLTPDQNGLIRPDWIAGMFLLMPSSLYRELGGMDKKFRLYLEDVDFCTRAHLRGKKILVDSRVRIIHEAQRSSRKKLKYLWWHIQSAIRFFTSAVYFQALKQQ